jgi:hypothetical protein
MLNVMLKLLRYANIVLIYYFQLSETHTRDRMS